MSAVFKRELRSFFTSPVAYTCLAIMTFISGLFFYFNNLVGNYRSLTPVFSNLFGLGCFLVLPILSMRLFSEEKRQKTDQALFTAPVSLTGIVMGKFFAAMVVYLVGISVTLVLACVIAFYGDPGWITVFSGWFGLALYGGMVIAAGLFFSCLTESQLVAALATFTFEIGLSFIAALTTFFTNEKVIAVVQKIVDFLSANVRYSRFLSGVIHYSDIVFFLSMQALFLFLAVRVLDRKRWA